MTDRSDSGRKDSELQSSVLVTTVSDLEFWFTREVLPLESALMQFFKRSLHNRTDADDLCQDVYVRVCEAAQKEIPRPVAPFVFAIARNLLINRVRRDQIVSIEAVADLETLGISLDEPGPDRSVMARQELRRLQIAIDQLPRRCREAVIMRKLEGLSYREISKRMGISEDTVSEYLTNGMYALADSLHGEPPVGGKS